MKTDHPFPYQKKRGKTSFSSLNQPFLNQEQEFQLTHEWYDHHNKKALHTLIHSYSHLILSLTLRFRYYGISMEDLKQEGNLGLMHAISRFDPDRGVRFSTYARWWVYVHLQNYILKNWSIVRLGSTSTQRYLFFNLKRFQKQLIDLSQDQMSLSNKEKGSKGVKISWHEIEEMKNRLSAHDCSLSAPLGEGKEEWIDILPDPHPTPEAETIEAFDKKVYKSWIHSAIHHLNPKEYQVISLRYLREDPSVTLESIGRMMGGMSKEGVRQIEIKALEKMRLYLFKYIPDIKEEKGF